MFDRRIGETVCKRQCLENRHFVVHRAVFIDSTWNQSRGIFKDPRIKGDINISQQMKAQFLCKTNNLLLKINGNTGFKKYYAI